MHGIMLSELRRYVDAKVGGPAWFTVIEKAGFSGGTAFLATQSYPDGDAVKLFASAAEITKQPVDKLLESFGEFIVPDLLKLYRAQIDPGWKTLDLIEHTEATIHRVVRMRDPNAAPPELITRRTGPTEVVISYASGRKLCGVAKGIARGVAAHFGETIQIAETRCMHRGAKSCEIAIRKT